MEQVLSFITGRLEPKIDIGTNLFVLKGNKLELKGYSLLKLAQSRLLYLSIDLGLAHLHDLQKLFFIGLEIREEP
jgi:hypothetical protein